MRRKSLPLLVAFALLLLFGLAAAAAQDALMVGGSAYGTGEPGRIVRPCNGISITSQPMGQTVPYLGEATLSVAHSSDGPVEPQWYEGTSGDTSNPIPGATSTTFTTPSLTATTSYWVRLENSCSAANSAEATVTVIRPSGDVISIGGGNCVAALPGSVTSIPVYVRDLQQTFPDGVSPAVVPIHGMRLTVRFSPSIAIDFTGLTVSPAGVATGVKILSTSTTPSPSSSSMTYEVFWATPPAFQTNAPPPGDLVATIDVPIRADAAIGMIDMTVDTMDGASLLYGASGLTETSYDGSLTVENGCITALADDFTISCPPTLTMATTGSGVISLSFSQAAANTFNLMSSSHLIVPSVVTIPGCTSSPCPAPTSQFAIEADEWTGAESISAYRLGYGQTHACSVTLVEPSISVSPTTATLTAGQTQTLTVSLAPAPFRLPVQIWFLNSDTAVATVQQNVDASVPDGKATVIVTTKAIGDVTITALTGGTNRAAATLHVVGPCTSASISVQPANAWIAAGETTTLHVQATGTDLHYQWYEGMAPSTAAPVGTDSAWFVTPRLTATTKYWVRVKNSCSSINSNTVTVTVTQCIPPAITAQPASQSVASGSTVTLSVWATGTDLHYEWYEGAAPATTKRVGFDSPTFTTPPLVATTQYWLRVTNSCGTANSTTATLTVASACVPPAISTQPASQTIGIGEATTLSVAAAGAAPLKYQWYRGTVPSVSAPVGTNSAVLSTGALNTTTAYWVRVTNACGSTADSATATVTVVCRKPLTTIVRLIAQGNSRVAYTVSWQAVGGVTRYEIEESKSREFVTIESINTISGLSNTYVHTVASAPAVAYYYRVRGIKDCDESRADFSVPVAIVIEPDPKPEPPVQQGYDATAPLGGSEKRLYILRLLPPSAKDPLDTAFTVSTTAAFLTASPSSGTIPPGGTNVTITATSAGLPVGASTGTVNVTTPAGASIATMPASISLVSPVTPTPRTAPPLATALIIPAVAHVDTPTTQFVSDVRIANVSAKPIEYLFSFTQTGINGLLGGKQTTFTIPAGQTVALDDLAKQWFGEGANSGSLEIRPTTGGVATSSTVASSRTYAKMNKGTFGQFIAAVPAANFVGKGHVLSLQHIAQSATYRTNIGIVEGAGQNASVNVVVFDAAGKRLKEFALAPLMPFEYRPVNRILESQGIQIADGRIELSVTSTTGKIAAYASVLDNRTEDPFCVTAVEAAAVKATRYVVPGVADIRSSGLNWRSDLRIFNAATLAVTATLTFYPDDAPDRPVVKSTTIAAGEMKVLDNLLQSVFGIAADRKGAVHVTTAAPSSFVVTARTYFQSPAGTYGQFIPGLDPSDGIAKGDPAIQLLQLEESPRYRTNIGVTELSGVRTYVELTAVIPGEATAAVIPLELKPYQTVQFSRILKQVSAKDVYNARVTVRVVDGTGRVSAYASVVDASTSDPTYVPGQ